MDHTVKCLEEQQDEFDFKFKTHEMEGELSHTSIVKNTWTPDTYMRERDTYTWTPDIYMSLLDIPFQNHGY